MRHLSDLTRGGGQSRHHPAATMNGEQLESHLRTFHGTSHGNAERIHVLAEHEGDHESPRGLAEARGYRAHTHTHHSGPAMDWDIAPRGLQAAAFPEQRPRNPRRPGTQMGLFRDRADAVGADRMTYRVAEAIRRLGFPAAVVYTGGNIYTVDVRLTRPRAIATVWSDVYPTSGQLASPQISWYKGHDVGDFQGTEPTGARARNAADYAGIIVASLRRATATGRIPSGLV